MSPEYYEKQKIKELERIRISLTMIVKALNAITGIVADDDEDGDL